LFSCTLIKIDLIFVTPSTHNQA